MVACKPQHYMHNACTPTAAPAFPRDGFLRPSDFQQLLADIHTSSRKSVQVQVEQVRAQNAVAGSGHCGGSRGSVQIGKFNTNVRACPQVRQPTQRPGHVCCAPHPHPASDATSYFRCLPRPSTTRTRPRARAARCRRRCCCRLTSSARSWRSTTWVLLWRGGGLAVPGGTRVCAGVAHACCRGGLRCEGVGGPMHAAAALPSPSCPSRTLPQPGRWAHDATPPTYTSTYPLAQIHSPHRWSPCSSRPTSLRATSSCPRCAT